MEGYYHPRYAEAFAELGTPVYLPRAKGWLIKRPIPGTAFYDAMGPYPLFFCENWAALTEDLEALKDELVSVTLVIDPLANFSKESCAAYFEICKPYKDHYLLDLSVPLEQSISKNRRKLARRALRSLEVQLQLAPAIDLEEWVGLYACLVERHQIGGIRAFSRQSFASQIGIPNTHYFRVLQQGRCVGGNLYYVQGEVAYAHLSAFTEEGYAAGAPYAVKWAAIQHFSQSLRWMSFGGSTGRKENELSGLDKFKQGWSNQTGRSFFCAKILSPSTYTALAESCEAQNPGWFPAYRRGDF